MLKKIAIAVLVVLVALVAWVATRPDTFRIERSAQIKAPAEKIFPLIIDLHAWSRWSPWEKIDPSMKRTYSGAPLGTGATYAWQGNNEVGSGQMQITEATPYSKVRIQLDFQTPFEAHNTIEFTLVPSGDATEVTWAMYGPNTFVGKFIGLFVDMDELVGSQYEAGLANLRAAAEQ